jgi:type I restriction enzyme S subunit
MLPIPPLAEQRRIVVAIQALMAQVDAARERLAKVALILNRFRQAVLAAACRGELTTDDWDGDTGALPPGWRTERVGDLVPPGGLFDGPFGSNLKTSDYRESGVRVIRLENLGHLRFNEQKRTYVSRQKYEALKKHTVGEGDIIFGSFVEDAVRLCILPPLEGPAIAKADCFCIRPRPEIVDRTYLALQLATTQTHNALLEEIHGATRPRITTRQLRAVEVPVCPLPEQREIVARVDALFALADAVESRVSAALTSAERLNQAIVAKAFRGELVPTEAELARWEKRDSESAPRVTESGRGR